MKNLTTSEERIFKSLSTPSKIQDYLNGLGKRTDNKEPIVRSPRIVMKKKNATCMEGALFALAVCMYHRRPAFLLDLQVGSRTGDVDHVVTVFKENGHYGALSKTSHAVLRYRDPIYKTVRELALSYFHEYFDDNGKKNLRAYSKEFSVEKIAGKDWVTSNDDLYEIACALDEAPHISLIPKGYEKKLRRADAIEIAAGKLVDKN